MKKIDIRSLVADSGVRMKPILLALISIGVLCLFASCNAEVNSDLSSTGTEEPPVVQTPEQPPVAAATGEDINLIGIAATKAFSVSATQSLLQGIGFTIVAPSASIGASKAIWPGAPEICDDGLDNDLDNLIDCRDPDCSGSSLCPEASCCNGIDDNHNGMIDCADPSCDGQASTKCTPGSADICWTDGCTWFLMQEGVSGPTCAAGQEMKHEGGIPNGCIDLADNDGDGDTDCDDSDCWDDPLCGGGARGCIDLVDNDADGLVDCSDLDCKFEAECAGPDRETWCADQSNCCRNSADDDADGKIDCADSDCAATLACTAPGMLQLVNAYCSGAYPPLTTSLFSAHCSGSTQSQAVFQITGSVSGIGFDTYQFSGAFMATAAVLMQPNTVIVNFSFTSSDLTASSEAQADIVAKAVDTSSIDQVRFIDCTVKTEWSCDNNSSCTLKSSEIEECKMAAGDLNFSCNDLVGCDLRELLCADGVDNDGDQLIDCADSDCTYDHACDSACVYEGPEKWSGGDPAIDNTCGDGKDNDCDHFIDCADPDCADQIENPPYVGTYPKCTGCVWEGPEGPAYGNCNDGKDNDCNGDYFYNWYTGVDCDDHNTDNPPIAGSCSDSPDCPVCGGQPTCDDATGQVSGVWSFNYLRPDPPPTCGEINKGTCVAGCCTGVPACAKISCLQAYQAVWSFLNNGIKPAAADQCGNAGFSDFMNMYFMKFFPPTFPFAGAACDDLAFDPDGAAGTRTGCCN